MIGDVFCKKIIIYRINILKNSLFFVYQIMNIVFAIKCTLKILFITINMPIDSKLEMYYFLRYFYDALLLDFSLPNL